MSSFDIISGWHPIATAPLDGTVIEIGHEDCGTCPARWNPKGCNLFFARDGDTCSGIWEDPHGQYAWTVGDDTGPLAANPSSGGRMKAIRALLVDPISTDFVLSMIFGIVLTVGVVVAQILVTVWEAA